MKARRVLTGLRQPRIQEAQALAWESPSQMAPTVLDYAPGALLDARPEAPEASSTSADDWHVGEPSTRA